MQYVRAQQPSLGKRPVSYDTDQAVCVLGRLKFVSFRAKESQVLCTLSSRAMIVSPNPLVEDSLKLGNTFALLGV